MATVMHDLSIAARRLRRRPLFFLGACALLALAVGGSTAIFAIVNAVTLRPLPLRQPDAVVALAVVRDGTVRGAFSLPMFLDIAAAPKTLAGVAAYFQWSANLTDAAGAERLQAMRVTANYFDVLGAEVASGRAFTMADARPGSPPAVISDGLWKRRFGGSRDALGAALRLNGEVFTVVGVLRPDFTFQVRDAELVVPWIPELDARRANPALSFLRAIGRLAPGAGVAQAQAELEARVDAFRRTYPEAGAGDRGARVVPLLDDIVGSTGRLLVMLAGAVGVVLLIAGANLTNLLLVNGAGRLQEFSARRALGASPGQLVAQLLTEALILAAAGSLAGVVLAKLAVAALLAMSGVVVPRAAEIGLDATAVAFAGFLGVLVSVGAALLPALRLARVPLSGLASHRSITPGGRRLRGGFVCAEVALSVLLIAGAGLLIRSFMAVQRVEPGFRPEGVLSVRLSLPRARYAATRDLARFSDQLAARIRAIPGVSAVAAANVVPMNGYLASATIQIPGSTASSPAEWPNVHYRMISPDYLDAMAIPLVGGRTFTDADTAAGVPVAIVSQGMARTYWPQRSPIGSQVRLRDDGEQFRTVQIVGVAGDVKHFGLEAESPHELYVPIPQVPDGTSVWLANNMYWVARTNGAPLSYAAAIRREVAAVDPDVASSFVRSLDQWLAQSVDARRFNLRVIAIFAVTALLLAGIGVYGVAAEAVAVRTRELGVRAALGATDAQLRRAIMKGGLGPVMGGLVLGTSGAIATTQLLRSFLFGVTAHDPLTFAAVFVLVAAVGIAALYLPARRVARIDPVVALRE